MRIAGTCHEAWCCIVVLTGLAGCYGSVSAAPEVELTPLGATAEGLSLSGLDSSCPSQQEMAALPKKLTFENTILPEEQDQTGTGHCVSFANTALLEWGLQIGGLNLSEEFLIWVVKANKPFTDDPECDDNDPQSKLNCMLGLVEEFGVAEDQYLQLDTSPGMDNAAFILPTAQAQTNAALYAPKLPQAVGHSIGRGSCAVNKIKYLLAAKRQIVRVSTSGHTFVIVGYEDNASAAGGGNLRRRDNYGKTVDWSYGQAGTKLVGELQVIVMYDDDNIGPAADNCPAVYNPSQNDSDKDGVGNACDNCPTVSNPNQRNTDYMLETSFGSPHTGDACDGGAGTDTDSDGYPDLIDGCPGAANPSQTDTDLDGIPNACDPDADQDGLPNAGDNCNFDANVDQYDADSSLASVSGNSCDKDDDNDGIKDDTDNCPNMPNPKQSDTDDDGSGDVCELDVDSDGVFNDADNCVALFNPDQRNTDGGSLGDACDTDRDSDGVPDFALEEQWNNAQKTVADNCPYTPNASQQDSNKDGRGDVCQSDFDSDGVDDVNDNCAYVPNVTQANYDGDKRGDACDKDDDNDKIPDFFQGVFDPCLGACTVKAIWYQ